MLREMSGEQVREWKAYFEIEHDDRRGRELDRKGKAKLRRMMR